MNIFNLFKAKRTQFKIISLLPKELNKEELNLVNEFINYLNQEVFEKHYRFLKKNRISRSNITDEHFSKICAELSIYYWTVCASFFFRKNNVSQKVEHYLIQSIGASIVQQIDLKKLDITDIDILINDRINQFELVLNWTSDAKNLEPLMDWFMDFFAFRPFVNRGNEIMCLEHPPVLDLEFRTRFSEYYGIVLLEHEASIADIIESKKF